MKRGIRRVACDRSTVRQFWSVAALASSVGFMLSAGGSLAQDDRGPVYIARLVERLGSTSYADRVVADRELSELRSEARAQLEQAAKSPDAEIAARARELLRKIALDDLWQPSRVTYQSTGAPASAAITAIGEQTGNRLLVGDRYGGFRDGPVNLLAESASFWEVVDDVCRQTKNHVRPHFDTREPGLAVVSGEPGAFPVAYAGPVRAAITGALRTFSDEYDYRRLTSKQNHQFRLNLEMLWEDRLRVIAYRSQPDLIEAVTASGESLSVMTASGDNWSVATSGARQVPMELKIEPPPIDAARLATLKLSWPLVAIGDFASVETEKLSAGATLEQDGYEITIASFAAQEGQKFVLNLIVLSERPLPEPAESVFQECRMELLHASGEALRLVEQTNALEGRTFRSKLVFLGAQPVGPPVKLRVTYPRLRARRDLEIVFHDVPLPTARPQ